MSQHEAGANAPSPLSEALPDSLEEIFSSSPLERQPHEWMQVVTAMRAMRAKWAQDEAAGAKRAKATRAAPKVKATQELSLDDIDL